MTWARYKPHRLLSYSSMLLARFQFHRDHPIWWRLNSEDPTLFVLPKTDDWLFLSPLLYSRLTELTHYDNFCQIEPGKMFGATIEVVLATTDQRTAEAFTKSRDLSDDLNEVVEDLLMRLRHIGGQATIPKFDSCMGSFPTEISKLPDYVPPLLEKVVKVQKYSWSTAITAERIRAAAALGPDFVPPTHEVILLDAFAAYRGNDHRSAILYAATAAEAAFGSVIEQEYKRVIATQKDERFRIVELPQHGAVTTCKDPVYERLRSRPDFHVLIHELSLYVLRRSLLAEDEVLYQSAKRLHSTRNKIVHTGGLNERESGKPYALDKTGSMAALKTAIGLFSWLGERADFTLPDIAFVPHKNY